MLRKGLRVGCRGLDGGSAGQVCDAEVCAVFVAGEANWGDPCGSLVDKTGEDKQMHSYRRGGILGIARGGGDRFAYGFDGLRS